MLCLRFMVMELLRRNAEDERSHGQLFRDLCDEVRTIPFIEAIELLMQSFKNLVEELDKAGCIKDGMKEKALKIADSLVSKWYGQIAGFIKKLLSPNQMVWADCWIYKEAVKPQPSTTYFKCVKKLIFKQLYRELAQVKRFSQCLQNF